MEDHCSVVAITTGRTAQKNGQNGQEQSRRIPFPLRGEESKAENEKISREYSPINVKKLADTILTNS